MDLLKLCGGTYSNAWTSGTLFFTLVCHSYIQMSCTVQITNRHHHYLTLVLHFPLLVLDTHSLLFFVCADHTNLKTALYPGHWLGHVISP